MYMYTSNSNNSLVELVQCSPSTIWSLGLNPAVRLVRKDLDLLSHLNSKQSVTFLAKADYLTGSRYKYKYI